MDDRLQALTGINLDDLVSSFGWQDSPHLAAALRIAFRAPAEKFARQILAFDEEIGAGSLPSAARSLLRRYTRDVRIFGAANIPSSGPALVLSNHPGMVDTLALFSAINRLDLRIIALDRPFLKSLPHTAEHLFYVSDNSSERMSAVKKAAGHLRNGGAVLTFPAGRIEPDPEVYPGALESLSTWTDSAGIFMRFAPETKIIPALVRAVLWNKAVKHPLTRFKHDREEREKLGAAIQLLAHIMVDLHPMTVKIQFAEPLSLAEIGSTDTTTIHAAVLARMRGLIVNPPHGAGQSAL